MLAGVGQFSLVTFDENPGVPGVWGPGADAGDYSISLAFTLAATAMGAPLGDPLKYNIIRLETDLVAQLVDCPDVGPLRRRPAFDKASLHLRRLCSEAIGLAAAALLAHELHQWDPAVGWPLDLDQSPLLAGQRPDLRFLVPGGQVDAEARGRGKGRRLYTVDMDAQAPKLASLAAWSAAHNTKTFMSWAWANTKGTRVDYFDPGEPRDVVSRSDFVAQLRREAEELDRSARNFDAQLHETRLGPVRGEWLRPPNLDRDVFVGVLDPAVLPLERVVDETAPIRRGAQWRRARTNDSAAQIGPIATAVRPRDSEIPLGDML